MAAVEKKLVKSKSGYKMVTVDDRITSPFTTEEPLWTPDYACSHCQNMSCQTKFGFVDRKHHCRRCGKCFCNSCCLDLVALPRMCFIDPVRHCRTCAVITRKENEFFDVHLKTLLAGGEFRLFVEDAGNNDDSISILPGTAFTCNLSSDHRFLQFENGAQGQENIMVNKIQSVQVSGAELDQQGNRIGKGIAICYINAVGNKVNFKMEAAENSPCQQQSMNWVIAMLKAFKLVHGSKQASP